MTPLTPALTEATVARIAPVLETLLAQPFVARPGCALSVALDTGGTIVELGDFVIGDLSGNPYPNSAIARQKRGLSLRLRTDGDRAPIVQRREEDSPWTGSAYCDGLAVGCAGLSEEQDGMVAQWVAQALRTACFSPS